MARDHASTLALGGLLALAVTLAFWPTGAAAQTCDAPFTTDLVTGTGIHVGHVKVCNDADKLTVTYETTSPWCVTKTNLDVADSLAGIPQNPHGKPITGRFDYKNNHQPCTDNFGITIALGDWEPSTELFVAANATASDNGGKGPKSDAWGDGEAFPDDNGATYFTYDVQAPPPVTSCVCDRELTGKETGASILGRLCENGMPINGAVFSISGFLTSVQGPVVIGYPEYAVSDNPAGTDCHINDGSGTGFFILPGLTAQQVLDCQEHLRVSCGQAP